MIIVASKPGRLGNLLIVYANLLAWGLEHNKKILNPSFSPYTRYFRKQGTVTRLLQKAGYSISYYSARIIDRLGISNPLFGARHLDWEEKTNLDAGIHAIPSSPLFFLQGWQYRSETLLKKHAASMRKFFTPLPEFTTQLDEFWNNSVPPGDIVLGVHVRRGDYKYFENGIYYFDVDTYGAVMTKFKFLLGNEQVSFLICSDDASVISQFDQKGFRIIRAPGHELLDMYALARCNYIAGPPSTYSMWASFYGEVPLYMIRDPKSEFVLSDFIIQASF